jgi:hypothetical protein
MRPKLQLLPSQHGSSSEPQVSQVPARQTDPESQSAPQSTDFLQLFFTVPHFPAQVVAVDLGLHFFFFLLFLRFFASASAALSNALMPPARPSAAIVWLTARREEAVTSERDKRSKRSTSMCRFLHDDRGRSTPRSILLSQAGEGYP